MTALRCRASRVLWSSPVNDYAAIVVAAMLAGLLAACGTSPHSGVASGDAPAATDAASDASPIDAVVARDSPAAHDGTAGTCETHADCPSNEWCVGPQGCDVPWTCTSEMPCSAAPPFVACTCAGLYTSLSSGCPGERFGHIDEALPDHLLGARCQPSAPPVSRRDLDLLGDGFAQYEGLRAFAVLHDPTASRDAAPVSANVVNSTFVMSWYSTFDPGQPGYFVTLWFSDPGAFGCDDSMPVFQANLTLTTHEIGPAIATVSPQSLSESRCPIR